MVRSKTSPFLDYEQRAVPPEEIADRVDVWNLVGDGIQSTYLHIMMVSDTTTHRLVYIGIEWNAVGAMMGEGRKELE